jgi:hypothetical protein
LNISFSPLPGSAWTKHPIGNASCSQNPQIPLLQFLEGSSNTFSIWINLGTNRPTDGWIYQMADNGLLQPVTALTNLIPAVNIMLATWPGNGEPLTNLIYLVESWPGIEALTNFAIVPIVSTTAETVTNSLPLVTTNYNYRQSFYLTTGQLQNLVEGKWYAEVDYGDDKYLGNLVPMSITPPTATIIAVSPVTIFSAGELQSPFNNDISETVIAPASNRPATVILNGSGSDPFDFLLQYRWLNGPNVVADAAATTNRWQPGAYQIQFEASDGVVAGTENLTLEVISPEDAVNDLGSVLEQSNLKIGTMRGLASRLSMAQYSFARGDARLGEIQLADFQRRVRAEMTRTDSATANWLILGAQEIIEAVEEPGR